MKYSREVLAAATILAMALVGCKKIEYTPPAPTGPEPSTTKLAKIQPFTEYDAERRAGNIKRIEDDDAICYILNDRQLSCIPKSKTLSIELDGGGDEEEQAPKAKSSLQQM